MKRELQDSRLTLLLEDSLGDEFEGGEDRPLLLETGGVRGHRAWSNAPDISMMPSAGYEKHRAAHAITKHLHKERGIKV